MGRALRVTPEEEKGAGYFSSGVRGRDVVTEWKSQ